MRFAPISLDKADWPQQLEGPIPTSSRPKRRRKKNGKGCFAARAVIFGQMVDDPSESPNIAFLLSNQFLSLQFKPDWQSLWPVDEDSLRHLYLAIEGERFQARQQLLE